MFSLFSISPYCAKECMSESPHFNSFFSWIIKLPGVTKKEFKNNFRHKGIKEIRIISTWGVFKFNIKCSVPKWQEMDGRQGEEFIVRPWEWRVYVNQIGGNITHFVNNCLTYKNLESYQLTSNTSLLAPQDGRFSACKKIWDKSGERFARSLALKVRLHSLRTSRQRALLKRAKY